MTFYNEEHAITQQYQAQQELENMLKILQPGKTKVRIIEYARKQRTSVGIYSAYHPTKEFPFEVSIDGKPDFFALGQFTVIKERR